MYARLVWPKDCPQSGTLVANDKAVQQQSVGPWGLGRLTQIPDLIKGHLFAVPRKKVGCEVCPD
jgi:hypothetical protein